MIKAPHNTMASAPRWRTEAVPVHEHDWQIVGKDGRDEIYRVCTICDARSNAPRPRRDALRQAWLEYEEDWDDEGALASPPAPVAEAVHPEDEEFDGTPIKRGPGRPRKY